MTFCPVFDKYLVLSKYIKKSLDYVILHERIMNIWS